MIRAILLILTVTLSTSSTCRAISIIGKSEVSVEKMYQFVRSHNPEFTREIAESYISIGNKYEIRGDIALCQAILETGWFRFVDGTAVEQQQFNYCGLGVVNKGVQGCAFASIAEGITAQIQHLYAYATKGPLPSDETLVDPRFNQVTRGCALSWEDLSGRWAANTRYGEQIIALFNQMSAFNEDDVITIGIPDDVFDGLINDTLSE